LVAIMTPEGRLILTAIGPDQVGLVERISEFLTRQGCNIEDSVMAVYSGEFAVIVLVSGDQESLARVRRSHPEIARETGLSIAVKTPAAKKAESASTAH